MPELPLVTGIKKNEKTRDPWESLHVLHIVMDMTVFNPPAPPYTGWLPPLTRPVKEKCICSDDRYELTRWNANRPHVRLVKVRQICGCIGECCGSYAMHDCCLLAGGGTIPAETYMIPVIFKNSYHADHATMMYLCSRKYIDCVNQMHNAQLAYEKERFDVQVTNETAVLVEGEPCVDLRYYRFVE